MINIQQINYRIENNNTKLNYCIQILHYIYNELDECMPLLREKDAKTLDDAGARMYLLTLCVIDELKALRKDYDEICRMI